MASSTSGTNDIRTYEGFAKTAEEAGGVRLYRDGAVIAMPGGEIAVEQFWHPPLIVNLLAGLYRLAGATGVAFALLLRLLSIVADVGSALLVWHLMRAKGQNGALAAVVVAGSPLLLMVSGFHGNTDSVMLFFVLLTAWLLLTGRHAAWVGVAFGCSVSIKLWPVFLGLTFLLELRSWRARGWFSLAAIGVFTAGGLPALLEDPVFIIRHVLGYASLSGIWGLGRGLSRMSWQLPNQIFSEYGRQFLFVLTAILSFAAWRSGANLMTRCGLVAAGFLALTPGFGIQYLTWLVPWVGVLGVGTAVVYSMSAGLFMAAVYTYWCGGLPWGFADSMIAGPWRGNLIWLEIVCWLNVVYLWLRFLERALFPLKRMTSVESASAAPMK